MTVRELLGMTLREDAKGLPPGIQGVGYAAYLIMVAGLTYVGSMALGPYGGVVGVVVGVLLGSFISGTLFRGYRAHQQTQSW